MIDRTYDLILFGATGFTGKLVAEYLARSAPKDLRWAIAGRSKDKLEVVRRDLARAAPELAGLPTLVADSHDEAALDALVPKTKVICTTVGPFARYGRELARACARHGTHYCDITGEVTFIRASIDENHERATETRARIVHCCGFDSIPFDLGVHMLWHHAADRGQKLAWVKGFAGRMRGGLSGGTIASMMAIMEDVGRDPKLRRLLGNPYALDPDPSRRGPDRGDQRGVRFDHDLGRWTAPFVMSAINTRVVRRSNALLDGAYGPSFRYSEAQSFRAGPRGLVAAATLTAGLAGFAAAAMVPATRKLLQRTVLPAPGEGPSREERESGFFEVKLLGETARAAAGSADGGGAAPSRPLRLTGRVEGTSDPGYGETAKMLGESALCLALDDASLDARYGVLTPATAMGMVLVARLRRAGMVLDVSST